MKNNFWLVIILVFAFIFRLILLPVTYHVDILSQANWGDYVANHGPNNLYTHGVWIFSWPNHPPLTSLYYGFCFDVFRQLSLRLHQSVLLLNKFGLNHGYYFVFVDAFDRLVSPEVPFSLGFVLCLKLFPIIADILIGLFIYYLAKNSKLILVLLYLFLPFSWYISSLWGQTDQMSYLFVIVAFLVILKYPFWSIILFFIGGSLKPTSIFLIPLYLFILYKSKPKYGYVLMGIIACVIANYFIFKLFSNTLYFKFIFENLVPRLMDRPPRLTTNSFNFWHIITINNNVSSDLLILYIKGKYWGLLFFMILNVFNFLRLIKLDIKYILSSLFIVGFGSWLFLTEMLERYAFAGVVSGLILLIYYPKLFKYWLVLAGIFCLNLYNGWWFPTQLKFIQYMLEWNSGVITSGLAIINVLVYLFIIRYIIKADNEKQVKHI